MTNADLPALFARQLGRVCPDWPRRHFVAALSGGADSTALSLMASAALGAEQLVLAHLNHGLRAEAAQADEDFCRDLARRLGRPFISRTAQVDELARERGRGLEEAGRWARYDFLETVRRAAGADYILTGHHQDDLVETLLLGLLRGIGPAGLAGIPPKRGLVIRPLLECDRSLIESWLTDNRESWREDATNQIPRFTRNRIRLELKPFLETLAPGCAKRMAQLSRDFQLDEEYWAAHLAEAALKADRRDHKAEISFDRQALADLEPALAKRLILRAAWTIYQEHHLKEPPTHLTVDSIWQLARNPHLTRGGWDLPGGLRAETGRARLKLGLASRLSSRPDQPLERAYTYRLRPSCSLALPETGHTFRPTELTTGQAARYLRPGVLGPHQYLLTEAQMFSAVLTVRSPRSEDFLRLKTGRQKLNRIFSQAETPRDRRSSWPLLTDGDILWVVGLKRRHYEPTPSPRYYLIEVTGPDFSL